MKTLLLSFWLSAFALAEGNIQEIHAESASISYLPSSISCVVTACDYADFLNHVASSDSHFLYDEKMGTDSQVACIRRSGVAGSYHYEVIAGRENFPVRYVSDFNKEVYSSELNQPTTDNQQPTTAFLSSNQNDFEIDAAATSTLTLAAAPISHLPSSNRNSCLEEASSIAGIIGLAAFGHELMMRPGETRDGLSPIAESDEEDEERTVATDAEEKDQRELRNPEPVVAVAQPRGVIDHEGLQCKVKKQAKDAIKTTITIEAAKEIINENSVFHVDSKPTPAEQELATYQRIAQRAHERAIEISNEARATKTKAHENNFEKELAAYQAAEQAWIAALEANREVISKAEALSLSDSDLQPLRAASHNAEVHRKTWEAYHFWLNARRVEHKITTTLGDLTHGETLEAEAAWSEAACSFKKILEKNPTSHRDELIEDAIKAEGAKSFWNERAEALKNQGALVTKTINKDQLLKKLTKAREKTDRAARNAVWSEYNQQAYEDWGLPGEIFLLPQDIQEKQSEEKVERISDHIEAPLMLDEEAEEQGRKLIRSLKQKNQSSMAASSIDQPQQEESAIIDPVDQIKQLASALTEKNKCRWIARKKADRLHQETAEAVKRELAAAETEAAENAVATEFDDRSSVGERASSILKTPWRPKLSVIGSEASTSATGITKTSMISSLSQSSVDLGKVADEAEAAWRALAAQEEASRLEAGGTPLEKKEAEIEWRKTDKKAIAMQEERERLKQEQKIAVELHQEWVINTARWKARAEADRKRTVAQETQKKATSLEQEMRLLNASQTASEKRKQELCDEVATTKAATQVAEKEVLETEHEWDILAHQYESLIKAASQGDDIIKKAKQKLKDSDRAVNELWEEMKKLYDPEEFQGPIDPDVVMLQQLEAKERYHQELMEHVQKSSELLDPEALEKYVETTKQKALQAAREKTVGAEEVWVSARIMALQAVEQIKQEVAVVRAAEGQYDFILKNLKRAESVAKTYDKALRLFEQESTRLKDIETLWIGIIEAKQKKPQCHVQRAVNAYRQGDENLWNALRSTERTIYNQSIKESNDEYAAQQNSSIKEAEDIMKAALEKAEAVERSSFIWDREEKIETAKKQFLEAVHQFIQKKITYEERVVFVEFAKLPSDQKTKEKLSNFLPQEKIVRLQLKLWRELIPQKWNTLMPQELIKVLGLLNNSISGDLSFEEWKEYLKQDDSRFKRLYNEIVNILRVHHNGRVGPHNFHPLARFFFVDYQYQYEDVIGMTEKIAPQSRYVISTSDFEKKASLSNIPIICEIAANYADASSALSIGWLYVEFLQECIIRATTLDYWRNQLEVIRKLKNLHNKAGELRKGVYNSVIQESDLLFKEEAAFALRFRQKAFDFTRAVFEWGRQYSPNQTCSDYYDTMFKNLPAEFEEFLIICGLKEGPDGETIPPTGEWEKWD